MDQEPAAKFHLWSCL